MLRPIVHGRVAWRDPRLRPGLAVLALALVAGAATFPGALLNGDEYYYAGQASTLLRGRLLPVEGDPLPVPAVPPPVAMRYPPAWPLLLAGGRAVSFGTMHVVALAAHLAGGLAVLRMLVRRALPGWLVAVYAFHPSLAVFSRTLLSDVPAVAAFLVAMDAWESEDGPALTASLAFATAARLASVWGVVGFALAVLPEVRERGRLALLALGGALVGVAAAGAPLASAALGGGGYAADAARLVGWSALPGNAALYAAGVLLLPPFAGLALARARGRADRWVALAVPPLLFALVYGYHDAAATWPATLVIGQRLVLLAHAALLVATSPVWSSWAVFRRPLLLAAAGLVVTLGAGVAMRRAADPHLRAARAAAATGARRVAYNMNAIRAAASIDADQYLLLDGRATLPAADVAIVAPGGMSRRPDAGAQRWRPPPALADLCCVAVGGYVLYDLTASCRFGRTCGPR